MPIHRRRNRKRRPTIRLGETFVAKKYGICKACGGHWEPGDYICYGPNGYGHTVCPGTHHRTYRVAPLD